MEFCPGGTDYVGTEEAGTQYLNATATCSSMATAFSSTYSVPATPTDTASIGTLDVVATVLPGVDGAAAIQQSVTIATTESALVTSPIGETPATSTGPVTVDAPTSDTATEGTTDGLIYGSLSSAAPRRCSTPEPTTVTQTVEDGTTFIEVYTPASITTSIAVALQSDTDTETAGRWLSAVPETHLKRVS